MLVNSQAMASLKASEESLIPVGSAPYSVTVR